LLNIESEAKEKTKTKKFKKTKKEHELFFNSDRNTKDIF
jgi:hypothetical protein